MTRRMQCLERGCDRPPHLGGRCREHAEEEQAKQQRRDAAIECLHRGTVDGSVPANAEVREELDRLRTWWHAACTAVNTSRMHPVLQDEAEDSLSWCISLAELLGDIERSSRSGSNSKAPYELEYTREWVWERFGNLERGLMSNGVARNQ